VIREWGPWIEHDGTDCPLCAGEYIMAQGTSGKIVEGTIGNPSNSCGWNWNGPRLPMGYVILYRIRRPRALQDLIDLVESLPAPAPGDPVLL